MKMPQKLRSFGFILLSCFFLAGTVLSACGTKTTEQTEEQTEEAAEEASEESQEHPAMTLRADLTSTPIMDVIQDILARSRSLWDDRVWTVSHHRESSPSQS